MGKIHAARLEASPRLQRVLAFLKIRGPAGATTREIVEHARVCAVNSCVDELREGGFQISGEWDRTHQAGEKAFRYRLDVPRPVQGDLFAIEGR